MYDRKKLIILRAILIVVGIAVGGTALWQYFVYYPDIMHREIQIVIIVVSAAVVGALLGLSAKAFYRLGVSIATVFTRFLKSVGVRGVVASSVGVLVAGGLTFAIDLGIRQAVDILAVRILADILIGSALVALSVFGLTKLFGLKRAPESEEQQQPANTRGYLLTASCFYDDRVYAAVEFCENLRVDENSAKALWKFGNADAAALERYKKVTASGSVKTLQNSAEFDSPESYIAGEVKLAAAKKLKPVVFTGADLPAIEGAADISMFSVPDEQFISAFARPEKSEETEQKPADSADGDEPHGQIIIDK